MKKFFILSLIATFVSVLSVSAQDNTYSMVIKMANGTTFTIGPNEVDSLWFNDGQVTVAGTNIMDLVKKIAELKDENEATRAWVYASQSEYAKKVDLDAILYLIDNNAYRISGNAQIVNPETSEPYTWRQYDWETGKYVDKPVTMQMVVQTIEANYAELSMRIQELQNAIANLSHEIDDLRNK